MKFLQKRSVAAVIMVLAILAGIGLGQSQKPTGDAPEVIGEFAYLLHNEGNVISQETVSYIEQMNESLFAQTGAQIVVDVVDTTGDADIADYAETVFTRYGIGSIERDNGILLVLALRNLYHGVPDGDYYVAWGSGFSASQQDRIETIVLDYLESGFAAKEYDEAVTDTFTALVYYLEDVYHVTVRPGDLSGASDSYTAIAGGYTATGGAVSLGAGVLLAGLVFLIIVLFLCWVLADAFRYQRYRRRYIGPGLPPPPVYYPVFWGRPRIRRPPPPPRPPKPPRPSGFNGGGSFGGGAGRGSHPGSFTGGGSFGGGAGRSSRPSGFSEGGSFGGGAGRSSRSSSPSGGARRSGGGVKRSGGGGMNRTGGSRGGGRRR